MNISYTISVYLVKAKINLYFGIFYWLIFILSSTKVGLFLNTEISTCTVLFKYKTIMKYRIKK